MTPQPDVPMKSTVLVFWLLCWLLVVAVAMAIAGIVAGIAFLTGFAPIALTLAAWLLCCKLFARDRPPWEQTRVAVVLLTGCFSYAILGASFHVRGGAAVAAVSLYLAYIVWRGTRKYADPASTDDESVHEAAGIRAPRTTDGQNETNPLGTLAALLLALFLMIIVVSPLMGHFFPRYWHSVTAQLLDWWLWVHVAQ